MILFLVMSIYNRPAPSGGETEAPCSLYMRELQGFVARCQSDYLSLFTCTDFMLEW